LSESGRRDRHSPRRIEHAIGDKPCLQTAIAAEDVDVAQSGAFDFLAAALFVLRKCHEHIATIDHDIERPEERGQFSIRESVHKRESLVVDLDLVAPEICRKKSLVLVRYADAGIDRAGRGIVDGYNCIGRIDALVPAFDLAHLRGENKKAACGDIVFGHREDRIAIGIRLHEGHTGRAAVRDGNGEGLFRTGMIVNRRFSGTVI
jgi:hypothetical protein